MNNSFLSTLMPCHGFPLLNGGNIQTLAGHFFPSPSLPSLEKLVIKLIDGDEMHLRHRQGGSTLVFALFHGLGGSVESGYMKRIGNNLIQQGHSVYLVNHRGAGEGLLHAKKSYHSGACEDVSAVLSHLYKIHPTKRIVAIGFSLSANLLLNLLGGHSGSTKPDAAIVVNPPIDLHLTSKCFEQGFNKVYDFQFVKDLKKIIHEKHKAGLLKDKPYFPFGTKLVDLDNNFTAPMAGYKNKDDYYTLCSSKRLAHNIQTPTVILHSHNDPFIPVETFLQTKFSDSVVLHLEKTGGHLGYFSKTPTGSVRWLDYFIDHVVTHWPALLSK